MTLAHSFYLFCFAGLCAFTTLPVKAQQDSLVHSPASAPAASPQAGSGHPDSLAPAPSKCKLFLLLASGIGSMNSTYTSEVVTGGYGGQNNVDDFLGKGYVVPVTLEVGWQIKRFKIGIGFSRTAFHVPSLTRSDASLDSTSATGALVKHQVKSFGTNYSFPLFLSYELMQKNNFSLDANVSYGLFFHDFNAYDGTYAPSATPNTPGYSFTFGFSPAYHFGKFAILLQPALSFTHVSYHGNTNEDLTDLSFILGVGISYHFH